MSKNRNPIARALRSPHLRSQVVPDKRAKAVRNPKYVHGDWASSEPCCDQEDRDMNGVCVSCGDPCL